MHQFDNLSVYSIPRIALALMTVFMLTLPRLSAAGIMPAKEDIIFVIENSAAMKPFDPEVSAPGQVEAFLQQLPDSVKTALLLFDQNVTLAAPFHHNNAGDKNSLPQALKLVDYQGEFSNSAAAIERALYELKKNARSGAGQSIIMLSRGVIDTGDQAQDLKFSKWLTQVLIEEAVNARIRIFTISLSDSPITKPVKLLAARTGGINYTVASASGMTPLLDQLSKDIFSGHEFLSARAAATDPEELSGKTVQHPILPSDAANTPAPDTQEKPDPGQTAPAADPGLNPTNSSGAATYSWASKNPVKLAALIILVVALIALIRRLWR